MAPEGLRALEGVCRDQGVPPPQIHLGEARGFRHRVKLSARGLPGALQLGLFEEGSHRLVAIPACQIHHASLSRLLEDLTSLLCEHRVEPYDEVRHLGVLRAVQLAVERGSGRVQVVLVCRDRLGPGSVAARALAPVIAALRGHPLVHSLFLNAQPEKNNLLLGDRFEPVFGPAAIRDRSGAAEVFYPPGAFGQANPLLHEEAIRIIHERIPAGKSVLELYAGTGSIGLGLCADRHVAFNEVGLGSLAGLEEGIRSLTVSLSLPEIHRGPAEDHAHRARGRDVVIVDPPRKGLSPQVVSDLCRSRPEGLIYLSCGLDSLLRDIDRLTADSFRVTTVHAFGYFPFTDHIETLVFFDKK